MIRSRLLVTAALLPLFACQATSDTAQGVAERFVDQHYVQINLPAAEQFCTGVALGKLRETMRLVQGVKIDDSTRKPIVRYRVTSKGESEQEATFLFDATIQVDGSETFERRWIVLTKKTDTGWKVANYTENSLPQ